MGLRAYDPAPLQPTEDEMSLFARQPGQSWIRVVSDADWDLIDLMISILADDFESTYEIRILK